MNIELLITDTLRLAQEAEVAEAGPEAAPEEPLEPHAATTHPEALGYAHADLRAAPTLKVSLEPSSAARHAVVESEEAHAPECA